MLLQVQICAGMYGTVDSRMWIRVVYGRFGGCKFRRMRAMGTIYGTSTVVSFIVCVDRNIQSVVLFVPFVSTDVAISIALTFTKSYE